MPDLLTNDVNLLHCKFHKQPRTNTTSSLAACSRVLVPGDTDRAYNIHSSALLWRRTSVCLALAMQEMKQETSAPNL